MLKKNIEINRLFNDMKIIMENWRNFVQEKKGSFTAEYQLFIPKGCKDGACSVEEFKKTTPVENRPGFNKPFGGLWTSTAVKDGDKWTSDWNSWMVHEMPHWMSPQGILLKPKTSNIFHVNTKEDAEQLYKEFPAEKPAEWSHATKVVDFEAALQKYDAIHFGDPAGKYSNAYDFGYDGMWDAESTVFRDASVVSPIEVVSVKMVDFDD